MRRPTALHIACLTAEKFAISLADIRGPSRKVNIVYPRQVAMWICTECLGMSTTVVGRVFGRDHTTVIYGRDTISLRMVFDGSCAEAIADIVHASGLGREQEAA